MTAMNRVARNALFASSVCVMLLALGCSSSMGNRATGGGVATEGGAEAARSDSTASAPPAPSAYNQSCTSNEDCVAVPVLGAPTDCTNCMGAAINRSDKDKYDAAIAAAKRPPKICPCQPSFARCVSSTCQIRHQPER